MKLTPFPILALLAANVFGAPLSNGRDPRDTATTLNRRDDAVAQAGPLDGIEKIAHTIDIVFDGTLRKIPGFDCVVPDPEYDGLVGSKGDNHGKPDCASLNRAKGGE
ncbi:hypothetical protein QQS21_009710 [Conoideocrella luteorostrata]|uniref:Uncharacterized protein n=1 Tax=Conoideocrella luteorostrata TaxID=1105319 RepID=A0AAJ0FVE4_9HYPO|nr:hypothetical protein QQS21_009710 [Conoideocrella luteorostrata]